MEPAYLAARRVLAAACLRSGRESEALTVLEATLATSGDDPVTLAWLAHARAVTGCREMAVDLALEQATVRRRPRTDLSDGGATFRTAPVRTLDTHA